MNLEDDILIERYLKNILSESEKNTFLERLEKDDDFKEKMLFEKQLFETLNEQQWSFVEKKSQEDVEEYKKHFQSKTTQDLKKKLQTISAEYQNNSKSTKSNKWMLYAVAATVALMVTVFNFVDVAPTNQQLYAENLSQTALPSLISRGNSQQDLAKAQTLFENKNYKEALSIFSSEMNNSKEPSASICIYSGISQMELGLTKEAEKTFETLIQSNLLDASKGKWYKALLFLKMDKVAESKNLLKELVETKGYRFEEAETLLKKLK